MREILNDADFADFLVASEVGVLHVASTWWPPRDQSEALLRERVVYMEPDVSVASVNADKCVELCDKLDVRSVPAILVFQ
jgi:thioredoxin-like negative regulator of GroEL